jgi:hypothetical protein
MILREGDTFYKTIRFQKQYACRIQQFFPDVKRLFGNLLDKRLAFTN